MKRVQRITNYSPHFTEVNECLLMFLLNVLLDLTDELEVFDRLFEFFIVDLLSINV